MPAKIPSNKASRKALQGLQHSPKLLTSITAFACERILQEADGVVTAIRIVDLFRVPIANDIPIEKQAVGMSLYIRGTLERDDGIDHRVAISVIRPDGQAGLPEDIFKGRIATKFRDAPPGFNVAVQFGIIPKQFGTHHIAVVFDGETVFKLPITLRPHDQEASA